MNDKTNLFLIGWWSPLPQKEIFPPSYFKSGYDFLRLYQYQSVLFFDSAIELNESLDLVSRAIGYSVKCFDNIPDNLKKTELFKRIHTPFRYCTPSENICILEKNDVTDVIVIRGALVIKKYLFYELFSPLSFQAIQIAKCLNIDNKKGVINPVTKLVNERVSQLKQSVNLSKQSEDIDTGAPLAVNTTAEPIITEHNANIAPVKQTELPEPAEERDEEGLTRKQREILNQVIDHLSELQKNGTPSDFWINSGNYAIDLNVKSNTLAVARNRGESFSFRYNDVDYNIGLSSHGIWAKIADNINNYAHYKRY